jgi:LuxR family maltose regulon positive regulatory protein
MKRTYRTKIVAPMEAACDEQERTGVMAAADGTLALSTESDAASDSVRSWRSSLVALLGTSGVELMRRDAETAVAELSYSSPCRRAAVVLLELAELLDGDGDGVNAISVAAEYARRRAAGLRGWPGSLTDAELRLLPLLATHMSFREIGTRLYVSRNTVKTQAISIYRKLDASSRSEAIHRAIELDLVRPTLGTPPTLESRAREAGG